MKVLFAAGDIGGGRALLPVMAECEKHSLAVALFDHGDVVREAPAGCELIRGPGDLEEGQREDLLKRHRVCVLVFASSIKDPTALTLARAARRLGIPVIHLLDGWSNYCHRLSLDGLPPLIPDRYTVIDELAYDGAVQDGIDPEILTITGQPSLAALGGQYENWLAQDKNAARLRLGISANKDFILFVSEPAGRDQGISPDSPYFRGYTEEGVLQMFCNALQPHQDRIEVGILPHPRENLAEVTDRWQRWRGPLTGSLLTGILGRQAMFMADGVVGMASILLYEAWLLGKPVISLQPGVRSAPLRMLQKREGVVFVDSQAMLSPLVASWLQRLDSRASALLRPEMQIHTAAPARVYSLVKGYWEQGGNYPGIQESAIQEPE